MGIGAAAGEGKRERCRASGAAWGAVSERTERTVHGYRRYRCRACGKQFNERGSSLLNRTQYPSDVIALVVLCCLRYKLALRDLPEMFLIRGIVFRRRYGPGKASFHRHLLTVCAAVDMTRRVAAGTSMRRISR